MTNKNIILTSPEKVADPVKQAIDLMKHSDLHKLWSVNDIIRLIIPPIEKGQALFAFNNDQYISFLTWGFFSEEVNDVFTNRSRPLYSDDWDSGNIPWLVDFICPFGNTIQIGIEIEKYLKNMYPTHYDVQWNRYKKRRFSRHMHRSCSKSMKV